MKEEQTMNNATTETGLALASLPKKWQEAVEAYRQRKCIVLAPTQIVEIPPYHVPVMSLVEVNTDERAGEVYPVGGGKFGLSATLHDRISQAAAITWDAEKSGRTDDGTNPRRIRYKSVAKWKDLSGTWREVPGEKELDLDAIEDELRQSVPMRENIQKLTDGARRQQAINDTVTKEMIQIRKHGVARAQTGSMNRAVNKILGLRSSYTKDELSHGIVVPRLAFRPDYNDPQVRQVLLAVATGTIKELYGAQAELAMTQAQGGNVQPLQIIEGSVGPPPAAIDVPEPETDRGVSEPPPQTEPPQAPPSPPPVQVPPVMSEPDPDEVRFAEADGDAKKEQEALIRLMGRKSYDTKRMKKPLDQFDKGERRGFLKYLLAMPDAKTPELPWQ